MASQNSARVNAYYATPPDSSTPYVWLEFQTATEVAETANSVARAAKGLWTDFFLRHGVPADATRSECVFGIKGVDLMGAPMRRAEGETFVNAQGIIQFLGRFLNKTLIPKQVNFSQVQFDLDDKARMQKWKNSYQQEEQARVNQYLKEWKEDLQRCRTIK